MNVAEAVQVWRAMASVWPHQATDEEYGADSVLVGLGDLAVAEVQAAIARLVRSGARFASVAEVRAEVDRHQQAAAREAARRLPKCGLCGRAETEVQHQVERFPAAHDFELPATARLNRAKSPVAAIRSRLKPEQEAS